MAITAPHIISVERGSEHIRIELSIPTDLVWFEGHFPGAPILPGVVQTHWAIELGREHYPIYGDFQALSNIKFMRIIEPGMRVALQLKFDAAGRALSFQYLEGSQACSAGTVRFASPE